MTSYYRLVPPSLLLLALLGACSAQEEESVEDRFRRTEAAIETTAKAIEAETENAVAKAEQALENQADSAVANRVEIESDPAPAQNRTE